jgi:hypothetical protein
MKTTHQHPIANIINNVKLIGVAIFILGIVLKSIELFTAKNVICANSVFIIGSQLLSLYYFISAFYKTNEIITRVFYMCISLFYIGIIVLVMGWPGAKTLLIILNSINPVILIALFIINKKENKFEIMQEELVILLITLFTLLLFVVNRLVLIHT